MIHMASVWVPFTSESKEAIADYDEIRKEMKLALMECGRKLGTYLRKRQKMQREAEAHAEEDKKAQETIEIKNNADMLAYQSEKQLKELGDKISGDKKKQVEDAIAAVRDAINRNDTDAIKRSYDDLQNKFQDISAELYKQASAQAGPRPGPQPGPEAQPRPGAEEGSGASKRGEGDVVDAEFEVVDENKKK